MFLQIWLADLARRDRLVLFQKQSQQNNAMNRTNAIINDNKGNDERIISLYIRPNQLQEEMDQAMAELIPELDSDYARTPMARNRWAEPSETLEDGTPCFVASPQHPRQTKGLHLHAVHKQHIVDALFQAASSCRRILSLDHTGTLHSGPQTAVSSLGSPKQSWLGPVPTALTSGKQSQEGRHSRRHSCPMLISAKESISSLVRQGASATEGIV